MPCIRTQNRALSALPVRFHFEVPAGRLSSIATLKISLPEPPGGISNRTSYLGPLNHFLPGDPRENLASPLKGWPRLRPPQLYLYPVAEAERGGRPSTEHLGQLRKVVGACINKSNRTELSEAIIFMFQCYQKEIKCYEDLSDVSVQGSAQYITHQSWEAAFQASRWFARGWSLTIATCSSISRVLVFRGNIPR